MTSTLSSMPCPSLTTLGSTLLSLLTTITMRSAWDCTMAREGTRMAFLRTPSSMVMRTNWPGSRAPCLLSKMARARMVPVWGSTLLSEKLRWPGWG
ncbi:hypothetical protein D3C80_1589060 [compost metagenome]